MLLCPQLTLIKAKQHILHFVSVISILCVFGAVPSMAAAVSTVRALAVLSVMHGSSS